MHTTPRTPTDQAHAAALLSALTTFTTRVRAAKGARATDKKKSTTHAHTERTAMDKATHTHTCPDCYEDWECEDVDCDPEEAEGLKLCNHCRQAYWR